MTSRLITILAVALAVAALVGASIRLTGSSHSAPRAAHASLPPSLASYLGVFEPGAPPVLRSGRGLRGGGGPRAKPARVLQRVGAVVRHVVR